MSETLKALGEQVGELEWPAGRVLKVSPITFKIRGLFADVLRRRAAEGLQQVRAALGEEGYQDALRGLRDDLSAGEFEWQGRVARAATQSPVGTRELAYLCLLHHQPNLKREEMQRLFEDGEAWPQLLGVMNELNAVPKNGRAPPGEPAGGQHSGTPT